jgi:hypothetical protein
MSSEIEFLQRRLYILDEIIKKPSQIEIDQKGGFHIRLDVSPHIEHNYIREAHTIQKLLSQAKEGQVSRALTGWRKSLGEKLRVHREFYRPMQEVYDRWLSYPFPTRIEIPEPPYPPELEITDIQGDIWVVDEKLLSVIDDLQGSLSR